MTWITCEICNNTFRDDAEDYQCRNCGNTTLFEKENFDSLEEMDLVDIFDR